MGRLFLGFNFMGLKLDATMTRLWPQGLGQSDTAVGFL
jgi:hypothetical protein